MSSEIMTLDSIERQIKNIIGEENFSNFSNFLFENAFQEAPYLGINRKNEEFQSFAIQERAAGMAELYSSINDGRINSSTVFKFPGEMQIKVSLRRDYFNGVSPEYLALEFEPYVRRVFGRRNFRDLENWVFDYACKEADYFEKEKGKDFDRIVSLRRGKTILDVAETIDDEKIYKKELFLPSEKTMDMMFKEQLRNDRIVSLKMNSNILIPQIYHLDEGDYLEKSNN
ncbi:hypothetical protein GF378_03035 [Candidatus Pacearchaeota archaeon]|nr:hypothetical protein [Candidatus Pacearchaeota archaeon]